MRNFLLGLAASSLVLVALAQTQTKGGSQAAWEYRILEVAVPDSDSVSEIAEKYKTANQELDQLGMQGWELSLQFEDMKSGPSDGEFTFTSLHRFVLKRPVAK